METSSNLATYNKSVVCRICMRNDNNYFSIFNEICLGNNKVITIAEIISECTKYPVAHNDQLPAQICHSCVEMAKNAHRFKKQTEEAYCKLKALYDTTSDCKDEQGSGVTRMSALITHRYTQTEKTSVFLCESCPQKFFVESEIRHHRATVHQHDGKKCRVCGESFNHLGQLKIHLSTAHPSEGIRCDFRCHICCREFTRKDHLKRHLIRVHKLEYMDLKIKKVSLEEPEIENPSALATTYANYSSHWADYIHEYPKEPIAIDDPKNQTTNATNPFSSEDDVNEVDEEDVIKFVENISKPEISIKVEKADNSYNISNDNSENLSKLTDTSEDKITVFEPEKSAENFSKQYYNEEEGDYENDYLTSSLEDYHSSSEENTEEENEPDESPAQKEKYNCEPNKKVLKYAVKIIKSIKKEHTGDIQTEGPTSSSKKIKNENSKPKQRRHYGSSKTEDNRCKECDRSFTRYNHLLRHMLTHSDEKPHICSFCGKGFSRSDHVKKHIQSIHCEKTFKCDQCSSAYGRKDHLERHIETRHNKDPNVQRPQFNCEMCEKKFTTKAYLAKHKLLHTDRIYVCKHCTETFQNKEQMKEHQKKAHIQPRNFLCNICGDSFQRNEYLKIHMRRHTGEKPYKCRFCEKGFPRSTDLKMHERYHMGHKPNLCNLCGKGFHRPYNLTIHMRTHTGEKPYKCNQCPQAFAQSNDLKAHIRRHTGERFRCDICSAAFLQRYGLNAHLRTVHGIIVTSFTGRLRKTDQPINAAEQLDQQITIEPQTLTQEVAKQEPQALVQEVPKQEPPQSSLPLPPVDINIIPPPLYLGHHLINSVPVVVSLATPTSPIEVAPTHPSMQQMGIN